MSEQLDFCSYTPVTPFDEVLDCAIILALIVLEDVKNVRSTIENFLWAFYADVWTFLNKRIAANLKVNLCKKAMELGVSIGHSL